MKITEVRVHLRNEDKLKAFATVTFDDCFVVRNMKIISASEGLILCMPSRRLADGTYKDIAHPINMDFRKTLEQQVFACCEKEVKRGQAHSGSAAV